MGVNELEQLEHQVDASLKQIRSRKVYTKSQQIDNFIFDSLILREFTTLPNIGFVLFPGRGDACSTIRPQNKGT